MRRAPSRAGPDGFVLVTTLLVLLVLSVLAAASHFVATTNLDVARNTYAAAEAEFASDEGLDLALLALREVHAGSETPPWPKAETLLPATDRYAVEDLTYATDEDGTVVGGRIHVVGYGRESAAHRTSARFTVASASGFEGWQTTSDMTIKGRVDLSIPLAANGRIEARAARDARSSSAQAARPLGASGVRDDGSPHPCELGRGRHAPECEAGTAAVRAQALDRDGLVDAWGGTCSFTLSGVTNVDADAYPPGTRLCLEDGSEMTVRGEASGLTIVGGPDTTVRIAARSSDAASLDPPYGLRVSAASVVPADGMRLSGRNTLLAERDVVFDARDYAIEGTAAPGGSTIVRTLIASEGNVRFERKPSSGLQAAIFADGSVCKRGAGGMGFAGPIYARAHPDVDVPRPCTPGIYWNGGGGGRVESVENDDFLSAVRDPDAPPAGVTLVSRRP